MWVGVGRNSVLQVPGAALEGLWGGGELAARQQEGACMLQLEALVRRRRGGGVRQGRKQGLGATPQPQCHTVHLDGSCPCTWY